MGNATADEIEGYLEGPVTACMCYVYCTVSCPSWMANTMPCADGTLSVLLPDLLIKQGRRLVSCLLVFVVAACFGSNVIRPIFRRTVFRFSF